MKILFIFCILLTTYGAFDKPSENLHEVNDKLLHFLVFLMLVIVGFYSGFFKQTVFLFVFLCSYGLFIEFVQYFLNYRNFSNMDLLADLAGIITGFGSIKIINFFTKTY